VTPLGNLLGLPRSVEAVAEFPCVQTCGGSQVGSASVPALRYRTRMPDRIAESFASSPRRHRLPAVLLGLTLALLAWSAYRPHDYPTWALEVFPAVLWIVVLIATYRRFPMTPLLYGLTALHCALLIVGGHYTYSEVPIGNWARDTFDLSRNHYDRVGHFLQGFVPAILAREILIRTSPVKRGWWLVLFIMSICTAFSAVYELIEWAVAEIDAEGSQDFLGTQGDVWDTQKDILLCIKGAAASLVTLSRLHDGHLRTLHGREQT